MAITKNTAPKAAPAAKPAAKATAPAAKPAAKPAAPAPKAPVAAKAPAAPKVEVEAQTPVVKVGRKDLAEVVRSKVQEAGKAIPLSLAAEVIQFAEEAIIEALLEGKQVALPGFGTFSTVEKAAREGKNPQTGEVIQIAASTAAKFKQASALKKLLNGEEGEETGEDAAESGDE